MLAEIDPTTTSSTAELVGVIVAVIILAIGVWLGVIFWQERK